MAGSRSERKECWYSILGVEWTSSPEKIRSAYKREAMKWHPDKIQQREVSLEETTAHFQKIAQAYEILSNASERARYDKLRSKILASEIPSKDFKINVFPFFSSTAFSGYSGSGKGFYKVYEDVFLNIHKKEQAFARAYNMDTIGKAPLFGTPDGPFKEVQEFYTYWIQFCSIKDFAWCDACLVADHASKYSRWRAEETNAMLRKQGRAQFNEAVRNLAGFVKTRDKRWLKGVQEIQRLQKEKDFEEQKWANESKEKNKILQILEPVGNTKHQ